MDAVRRVVVATDFSPGSDAAVRRAVQLALAHGACLDLLHAFDVGAWRGLRDVFDPRRLAGEASDDARWRERLTTTAAALAAETGLEVAAPFGVGAPASAILAHLESSHAAVLVIARRADPGLPGVGSTLLRVLRGAGVPVLVVRGRDEDGVGRVMSAVDLRETSHRVAAAAVRLFPAAHHHLVCALDPAWEREVWRGAAGAAAMPAALRDLHSATVAQLDALARGLSADATTPVVTEVVQAVPVRALLARAAALRVDCVTVGRHAQGPWADRMLGSTALDLVHHLDCDVLVVP
jgi:nucleotide-binding universal stress UspA family protein